MKRLAKILAIVLLIFTVGAALKAVSQPALILKAADIDYFYGFNSPFLAFDTTGNISSILGYIPACKQASVGPNENPNLIIRVFLPSAGIADLQKLLANTPPGIKYIVTLSNFYANGDETNAVKLNTHCQGSDCVSDSPYDWYKSGYKDRFEPFVKEITKAFANDSRIFMWEIMNEPNCDKFSDCPGAMKDFINQISTDIKNSGTNALISPGLQGQQVGGEKFNGEYQAITNLPNITANSCHYYPNDPRAGYSAQAGLDNCFKAMEITKKAGRVFYVGETGWLVHPGLGCTPGSNLPQRMAEMQKLEKIFQEGIKDANGKTLYSADGFVNWRFDPLQSSVQHCDGSSIFPGDPMCGGGSASNPAGYANPPGSDTPDVDTRPEKQGADGPQTNDSYYPPLGSLQSCPPEVPIVGEVKTVIPFTPSGKYCVEPISESPWCQDPSPLIDNERDKETFCNGEFGGLIKTCYPGSRKTYDQNNNGTQDPKFYCGGDNSLDAPSYSEYLITMCNGIINGSPLDPNSEEPRIQGAYKIWQGVQKCARGQDPGDILLSDKRTLQICMGYFDTLKKNPVNTQNGLAFAEKALPACVPTKSANGRCTTTCGDPLKVNALVQMTSLGTCTKGDCAANINITPDSKLFVPLAEKLNRYFAGILDAGSVAEGYISMDELTRIKEEVAQGNTESINEMFAKSGVARKLLPQEIQDQLKCQFVNYVKDKVAKFANESTRENTKYIFKDKDGNITEFKINNVPVSQIQLPPFLDSASCSLLPRDKGETDDWSQTPSGQAWIDVPLFDNEDSQGAIEFVSGSPQIAKPESIKTSIPEIKRLYSVTSILQNVLMPDLKEGQTLPTPESLSLTIGPPIAPETNLLACNPTRTLKEIYGDKMTYALEPEVLDYTLGVECLQNEGDLLTDPDSQSEVCSVGSDGQINCTQVSQSTATGIDEKNDVLQTRNVQPYLFDVFLQTIESSRGLLRIFKPEYIKQEGSSLGSRDQFEEFYKPLPAESNKIQFEITQSIRGGVTLDEESKKDGWSLLFDKIGGVWTAKEFVLDLLQPKGLSSTEDL